MTRCDPEIDTGYTKADLTDKLTTYFCIHYAKGCCCEGVNCKYYHRVPSLQECITIDASRDIFGRTRYATHRDDFLGVGSFMQETKTIQITDFKMPIQGDNIITQMYEVVYRHFQLWGAIEDIHLLPNKGVIFIRYKHRCMAEFAKEAMQNQSLDRNEVILIKWSLEESQKNEKNKKDKTTIVKKAVERKHFEE